MAYIDFDRLQQLSAAEFQSARPYPWINPQGVLIEDGFKRLIATSPPVERFHSYFGVAREHGQQSHDRFSLDYRDDLGVAQPWREFVAQLRGKEYQDFLRRLLRVRSLELSFHWHYTPRGCSVSPHCDSPKKLGSHIFYFNTENNWQPDWGGETLILDDHGRFLADSAPKFEDFDRIMPAKALGNSSLLFMRRERSWHGVKEIRCPPDHLRKVFIVVIEDWDLKARVRSLFRGNKSRY
jgi:hypothetical protein